METKSDVIIIGGGLAGLTSALHLSNQGLQVTLIEKHPYPHHKVCGEYLSNEILPYFQWLNIDLNELQPTSIEYLTLTTQNGKAVQVKLPLGGIGASRYRLDNFLYQKAKTQGCKIVEATVTAISFANDTFTVSIQDQVLRTKFVLGAYGKRAHIDQVLSRNFIRKTTRWMAVKAHYAGEFPDDLIALHNFEGGYCGISKVENNRINLCYLTDVKSFKKYKNIADYQKYFLSQNKHLKHFFERNTILFDKPITISQISFERKTRVENHILMIGDTAGLIYPFCGNGMAMAIHCAKIASDLIVDYYQGKITTREGMETAYDKQWKKSFGRRLLFGRILAKVLQNGFVADVFMTVVAIFPAALIWIIKQTHGKPKTTKWE